MRVFIGPVEVAGQANTWARALRKLGVEAYNYVYKPHGFGYPFDRRFRRYGFADRAVSWIGRVFEFRRLRESFDVFHYLFGKSILRWPFRDYEFRALRAERRMLMSFFGDDIRLPSVAQRRAPDWVNAYGTTDKRNAARMQSLARYFPTVAAGGPARGELYQYAAPYFQRVVNLSIAVDLAEYPYSPADNARPVVLHAPSRSAAKGTGHVERAVARLTDSVDFEFRLLTGLTHPQVVEATKQANVVVDQLVVGEHGAYAVEAMALGKPVVCYIHPDFEKCYPEGFPIVNATPATLADVLRRLIVDRDLRRTTANESRAYAERVHDSAVVARQLLSLYEEL